MEFQSVRLKLFGNKLPVFFWEWDFHMLARNFQPYGRGSFLFLPRISTCWSTGFLQETCVNRLINYLDTKARCRHLKNWPVKGVCGMCLSYIIDWRCRQSSWYFRPSFVNCCPCNFLSGSTFPPTPLPCVNKYTVCIHVYSFVRGGGSMGFWASEDKQLPQSPFTGQFFGWRHFALSSMSLIFLRLCPSRPLK